MTWIALFTNKQQFYYVISSLPFFIQNANVLVEEKIEIWPGYRTSLRRHEEVPLLCCDLVNKIIRMDNSRVEIHKLMR